MSSSSNDRYLGRREFLRLGALTATSAGVSGAALGQNTVPEAAPPATAAAASPASRVLGRTGLKVNVIGIGTLQITEPALIQAAMDMGVNYIDTARVYINGRSEETVGKAVQGRRDKVFISTKTPPNTKTKQGRRRERRKEPQGHRHGLHRRARTAPVQRRVAGAQRRTARGAHRVAQGGKNPLCRLYHAQEPGRRAQRSGR
jgi:hypothetical protein